MTKMKATKVKRVDNMNVYAGQSLADIIETLRQKGITDLSQVRMDMDSVYPECNCGDYCYCESSYADVRVQWEI